MTDTIKTKFTVTLTHGEFDTYDKAFAACEKIIDDELNRLKPQLMKDGDSPLTPEALFDYYEESGVDPIIRPEPDPGKHFSGWDYAKKRCRIMCRRDNRPSSRKWWMLGIAWLAVAVMIDHFWGDNAALNFTCCVVFCCGLYGLSYMYNNTKNVEWGIWLVYILFLSALVFWPLTTLFRLGSDAGYLGTSRNYDPD